MYICLIFLVYVIICIIFFCIIFFWFCVGGRELDEYIKIDCFVFIIIVIWNCIDSSLVFVYSYDSIYVF